MHHITWVTQYPSQIRLRNKLVSQPNQAQIWVIRILRKVLPYPSPFTNPHNFRISPDIGPTSASVSARCQGSIPAPSLPAPTLRAPPALPAAAIEGADSTSPPIPINYISLCSYWCVEHNSIVCLFIAARPDISNLTLFSVTLRLLRCTASQLSRCTL